ncbi:MAG: hypothetical protein SGCHY_002913 [Lobulomycetales sp.]
MQRKTSRFDAFVKVPHTIQQRTKLGGLLTLLVSVLIGYMLIHELSLYMYPSQEFEFLVDQTRPGDHSLSVHCDLTIAMPCKHLFINVLDSSGETIALTRTFQKIPTQWSSKGYSNPLPDIKANGPFVFNQPLARRHTRSDSDPSKEACRINGVVNVNRMTGLLHITAAGHGLWGAHTPHDVMNFTHRIDSFYFGNPFPGRVNPLDRSYEHTHKPFSTIKYFLNLVPTIYIDHASSNPLRIVLGGRTMNTNQYAVTEYRTESDDERSGNIPGIFFKYEIEPISVRVTAEKQSSLVHFVVRLAAILGGLFVCTGILHDLLGALFGIIDAKKRD